MRKPTEQKENYQKILADLKKNPVQESNGKQIYAGRAIRKIALGFGALYKQKAYQALYVQARYWKKALNCDAYVSVERQGNYRIALLIIKPKDEPIKAQSMNSHELGQIIESLQQVQRELDEVIKESTTLAKLGQELARTLSKPARERTPLDDLLDEIEQSVKARRFENETRKAFNERPQQPRTERRFD